MVGGRRVLLGVLLLSLAFIPGCFLEDMSCGFFDEPDHCYQWWAIQQKDTEKCENIPGTGWEGQNPPKDKCYLEIAVKTGDPDDCLGAEGGWNGYDRHDCYQWMGQDDHSADVCDKHEYEEECRSGIAQAGSRTNPDCGEGWTWSGTVCTEKKPEKVEETESKDDKSDEKSADTESKDDTSDEKNSDDDRLAGTESKDDKDSKDEKSEDTESKDDKSADTESKDDKTDEKESKDDSKDEKDDDKSDEKDDTESKDDSKDEKDEKSDDSKDEKPDTRSGLERAVDGLTDVTEKIDKLGESAENLRDELTEAVTSIFEEKPERPTPEEEKQTRLSELVADIDDQEARSAIIEAFTRERKRQDDLTIEQQRELLQEIREEYEFNQAMDDKANTLKAETYDKLTAKVDELVEEKKQGAWDWIKDKTYGWVKGRTPEKYKDAAALAEERYNKAVEKYNGALESYNKGKDYFDKAKKAYDEMKQVMDNVRRLQNKVNEGRITEGQASAIKGGVLLGKGLEYTTKYIPVFGETISEVTAGTFQATMKFAEKRAERTTRLNACIDDPLNCDPNGISAY
jgi:hypothetical protein